MGESLTCKGTGVTESSLRDTAQEEIVMLEVQLESLKHNYEGWINMVNQATLPKQHQITERDLQTGLENPDLVWKEPQSLFMAMEEDPSWEGSCQNNHNVAAC